MLFRSRRLFYVAITRAEEHCFLSFAKMRSRYGKMEYAVPSRFLKDIDPGLIRMPGESPMRNRMAEKPVQHTKERATTRVASNMKPMINREADIKDEKSKNRTKMAADSIQTNDGMLMTGQTVLHDRFGRGEVLKVEGDGDNAKASISFENVGVKQLLLRFARLKIIG